MQPEDFRAICSAWNDSDEPGVVLHMRGGTELQGIARNSGYGDHLPTNCCWLSTPNGDVVVDILSILGMRRFRG